MVSAYTVYAHYEYVQYHAQLCMILYIKVTRVTKV
jgi:hypothetical protein